jgi:hypothetical protein
MQAWHHSRACISHDRFTAALRRAALASLASLVQSEPQFSRRSWSVGAGGASSGFSVDAAAVSPEGDDDVGHRSGLVLGSVSMAVSQLLLQR